MQNFTLYTLEREAVAQ